jgi:hypothetical protein
MPLTIASGPCINVHDTNASQAAIYSASMQAQAHQHDADAREREAQGRLGLEAARLGQQQSQWAQEPERQVATSLAINKGRLTQQEEMDNLRQQNQIGAIRSAINDGTISEQDGARHILKLQGGVDYYATRQANQQAALQQQQIQHASMQNQMMTGMQIQANQAKSGGLESLTRYDYDPRMREQIQNDVRNTRGHLSAAEQEMEVKRRLHDAPGGVLGRWIAEQNQNGGITMSYQGGHGRGAGGAGGESGAASDRQLQGQLATEATRLHTEWRKHFDDAQTSGQARKDAMALAGIRDKKWEDLTPEERERAEGLHHTSYLNRGLSGIRNAIGIAGGNQGRPGAQGGGMNQGGMNQAEGDNPTPREAMQTWSRDIAEHGLMNRPVPIQGPNGPATVPLGLYVQGAQQRVQNLLSQSRVTDRDRDEARDILLSVTRVVNQHVPEHIRNARTNPPTPPARPVQQPLGIGGHILDVGHHIGRGFGIWKDKIEEAFPID